MAPLRALVRVAAVLLVAALPACRCGSGGPSGAEGEGDAAATRASPSPAPSNGIDAISPAPDPEDRDIGSSEAPVDASNRFRDAEPKVDVDLEGSPDPACTGAEVMFAAAVVDARCAIGSSRAKKLRALLERDGGAVALRQEARVVEEGRVALRLMNKGASSIALPLSFHAKLPAFSVLAEDARHTLYELEAPPLELRDPAQGNRSHFARVVLPPGGVAVATIAISPVIMRVLGRGAGDTCKDGGATAGGDGGLCSITRLQKGRYVLHIGELLTDVEVGAPARVTWDLP